jgi:alcohol dehydrogenase class IV
MTMFDVNIVIGIGNNSAISTSKIMKITAIKKNRDENYRSRVLQLLGFV